MIVNEDLANLVNEVVDKVNDVVSQYGFDNLKDFEQFVMANKEEIEVVLQDIDVNTDISISDDAKIFSGEAVSDTEESADTVTAEDDYETTHNKSVGNNGGSELGEEGLTKKIVADTTTETTRQQAGHHNSDSTHSQIANTFNQAIDNAVVNNGNVDVTAFAGNVQEADIIRQIIDQIKVNAGREVQSMEVQLNPENLGKVYVDGVLLEESYIREKINEEPYNSVIFPFTVSEGCVFVMGDNRNESSDSRNAGIGEIDTRYIMGEAGFRIFPFDSFGFIE